MAKAKKENTSIKFSALISQIKTLKNGGTIILSISEKEKEALMKLLEAKLRIGTYLDIIATPIYTEIKEENGKEKPAITKRIKRYPYNKSKK